MNIYQIQANKPQGATHYMELGRYTDGSGYLIAYYQLKNSKLFVFDCGVWVDSEYSISNANIKPL